MKKNIWLYLLAIMFTIGSIQSCYTDTEANPVTPPTIDDELIFSRYTLDDKYNVYKFRVGSQDYTMIESSTGAWGSMVKE